MSSSIAPVVVSFAVLAGRTNRTGTCPAFLKEMVRAVPTKPDAPLMAIFMVACPPFIKVDFVSRLTIPWLSLEAVALEPSKLVSPLLAFLSDARVLWISPVYQPSVVAFALFDVPQVRSEPSR